MPYGSRCGERCHFRVGLDRLVAVAVAWGLAASSLGGHEPADAGSVQDLGGDIAVAMARADMGPATVGVHVLDLATGEVLAEIDRSESGTFIPASNMKLLTSGAALQVLGPEFAFKTEIRIDEDRLIVVGGGDPGLGDPELLDEMALPGGVEGFIRAIAERIAAQTGARAFREIVVDDRIFDRRHTHPEWPVDQLNKYYCAEVSGLNFHLNLLYVRVNQTNGRLATNFEPDMPWLEINVDAVPAGLGESTNSIWISRAPGESSIRIGGKVRTGVFADVTIHDPATNFGRLLARELDARGLMREDPTASVRLAGVNEQLPDGELVLVVQTPIQRALARCNSDSYNLYAEAFMKRIGALSGQAGSWTQGAAMLRMVVTERIGSDYLTDLAISDGSGMSRENRVSPELMTRWLASMHADTGLAGPFLDSLARPGVGTLRHRFRAHRPENLVQAKTGYLNGVRTMSGYVTDDQTGRSVAFSVLVNDVPRGAHDNAAKQFQEEVVLLIDGWLETQVQAVRAGVDEGSDGRGG